MLIDADGNKIMFTEPHGDLLPPEGFPARQIESEDLLKRNQSREIRIDPNSDRLQVLTPFPEWDGKDLKGLPLLIKGLRQMHDRSHFNGREMA